MSVGSGNMGEDGDGQKLQKFEWTIYHGAFGVTIFYLSPNDLLCYHHVWPVCGSLLSQFEIIQRAFMNKKSPF
jgi:hypothetical protein